MLEFFIHLSASVQEIEDLKLESEQRAQESRNIRTLEEENARLRETVG